MKRIVKKRQLLNKRIVLNIILVLFMFLSIGYSTLSTNLNINGNLNVKKYYEPTLYNVLAKEADTGGLARKYIGEHHDSFTEEPSKDIYHWYAENDTQGTQILDKNNVIFAGQCFQMIRTTDTGGVKMIYNGEADDGKCLNTRGNHVGYSERISSDLSSSYWYGTDYTYDNINKTFSLSGTTEETTWNATTNQGLIGKYTCKKTSVDDTCSTLYLVESFYTESEAYVIPLNSNSHFSQFGKLQFNADYLSPSLVGYVYGDVYVYTSSSGTMSQDFTTTQSMLSSTSLRTSYWYASEINYGTPTTGRYSLVDPYQVSSTSDYINLIGKYTFRSTTQTNTASSVYYIAGVNNTTMYYAQLTNGNLLSGYEPIMFGDSITDNGDNTYTINNPISVTLSDWYVNYANYKEKYTCNDSNITCTNPRYTTATTSTNYTYVNAGEKIIIGKTRSALNLNDTILVRKDEWYNNYSSYGDYKYTCNNDSATCTEANLRIITIYNKSGYKYAPNRYWGRSVTWDGENYTLVDPIELENYNNLNNLSTHHYMCSSNQLKICSSVVYIYYYPGSETMDYVELKNGETSISKLMENMFTKNITNSTIKSGVDAWYKHTLFPYDEYLEDTIFCNDRSIRELNGWNPDGGMMNKDIQFKEYYASSDLNCTNVTDKFSTFNNEAKLVYKVGLLSSSEINILNNNNARKSGQSYWLFSPGFFNSYNATASVKDVGTTGSMYNSGVESKLGVRPAISLKPGTEYISGEGSMANPYVVDTSGN